MRASYKLEIFLVIAFAFMQSCSTKNSCDPMENKGIGPIENVELGKFDQSMADEGRVLYDQLCRICHDEFKQMEGPAHKGILKRRTPEWIMNMMLNPTEMANEDFVAKILAERVYGVEMPNMGLKEEEARKILEYFRTLD